MRRPWLSRVLMFATVIVLVDALVGDRGFAASFRAGQDYRIARARLAELQAENAGLRERMRRLTVDRRTIEGLAREQMGFVRPGEVLFILEPVGLKPVGAHPLRVNEVAAHGQPSAGSAAPVPRPR